MALKAYIIKEETKQLSKSPPLKVIKVVAK